MPENFPADQIRTEQTTIALTVSRFFAALEGQLSETTCPTPAGADHVHSP